MDILKNLKKNKITKNEIRSRSSPAVCGVFEREMVVRTENVEPMKRKLRERGFIIVGTSEPGRTTRKIWFVPSGAAF